MNHKIERHGFVVSLGNRLIGRYADGKPAIETRSSPPMTREGRRFAWRNRARRDDR